MMITHIEFLKKYNISEESYAKTGLSWDDLVEIYNAYNADTKNLVPYLNFFVESLRSAPSVHSIKARLKDAEHVIEKIIREKFENPSLEVNVDNYSSIVTDLIGLRALHLFKEDWESIHNWIIKSWELKSKPVVNIREGDSPELIDLYEKKDCEVKKHPFGYRSAHYIVVSKPTKNEIVAEIQVRTIFEEGWSEIDHLIRYPYVKDNPILEQYLVMFNRLSGSADEMGSYIKFLEGALKNKEQEFDKAIAKELKRNEELKKKIKELETKIEEMEMEKEDKVSLMQGLTQISDISSSIHDLSGISPLSFDASLFGKHLHIGSGWNNESMFGDTNQNLFVTGPYNVNLDANINGIIRETPKSPDVGEQKQEDEGKEGNEENRD